MGRKEIAHKIRRIGERLVMMQNSYIIALFNFTATETVNKRVLMALKELREHAKALLDNVDELIRELEETMNAT